MGAAPQEPIVSIVINNHNYDQFLRECGRQRTRPDLSRHGGRGGRRWLD